jgi:hypothetical protein
LLHSAIVASADESATCIKDRRANRNATFCQTLAGFNQSDRKQRGIIHGSGNLLLWFKNGTDHTPIALFVDSVKQFGTVLI